MASFGEPSPKKFCFDKFSHNKYNNFLPRNGAILKKNNINDITINGNCNGEHTFNQKKNQRFSSHSNSDILKKRLALPIYEVRKDLLNYLHKNDTNILIGETGSGKTTQVPQFLYEEKLLLRGSVIVTQPRRVAAITVAIHVAKEMDVEIGELVGYSVRFEEVFSVKTKIKFATDGMLMREAMLDPLLKKYAWVILDEAHERTVNTDILFGVVKKAQKIRKERGREPLHILVMSATMNAEKMSTYFNNCPVLIAEGREHNIDIFFRAEKKDEYILSCLSTVMQIHEEAPPAHDILVFLTGQEEIDNACIAVKKILKRVKDKTYSPLKVCPMYSALPQHLQMEVFEPCRTGERKVIFSTNIAETSVTIPGIRYVVDSGKAKVRSFNATSGFDTLKVCQISQAQAWQRAGRAGREAPGTCYHTYTEEQFEKMTTMPLPEILRSNLATVVLQLLTVGIKDVVNFDFMDKPKQEYIQNALDHLLLLGAIEKDEGGIKLTEEGKLMSTFPLEPRYAKVLLNGPKFNCTQEAVTVVAMLSTDQVLVVPSGKLRALAKARHKKFASPEGDHVTLLKIFRSFKAAKMNKAWCQENFLNHRNLSYAADVRAQLCELCVRAELAMPSCGENTADLRRCFLTGMFTHVAEMQLDKKYVTLDSHDEARIHPSSVMFSSRSAYLLYNEIVNTGTAYMHCVSTVLPEWLYEMQPDYFRAHHIRADADIYDKAKL